MEVYDIEINLLAQKRYSESLIRGYINHSTEKPIYSSPQRFPKIYNISEVQLQLNNIPLPTKTDNYEVDNYTIENQVCCLNSPSPCNIDIVTDQSNTRVGETCVDFNLTSLSLKDSQMVELRYTVCNAINQTYWIKYIRQKGANVNASITLMNYRQQDSQTSCNEGLRHGKDSVVFKAHVCLTQYNSIVKFVTKKLGDVEFHELCNVTMAQGCTHSQEVICYCNHTDSTNTHHIVVNVTADRQYSGAHIQGVLVSEASFVYSKVQRFPKIYNISEIKLTVNELNGPVLIDKLEVDTNVSEINICCRDSPSPCRTKVVSNDVVVASGVPCVVHNFSNHDNGTVGLRLDVCDVTEYKIPVRFLQDSALLTSFMKMDTLLTKVTTLAATIIVSILVVFCAIRYVKARGRSRSARINKPDTGNKGYNLPEDEHIYAVVEENDFPIGTFRYINRPRIYTLSSDLSDTESSLQWGRAETARPEYPNPHTKSRQTCVDGMDYITPCDMEDRDEMTIF